MEEINVTNLPVIPLRGLAILPGEIMHCDIGRKKSLSAMEAALKKDALAFFVTQEDASKTEVTPADFPAVGTVCRIRQVFRIQGETVHLLVTGIARAKAVNYAAENPHFLAEIRYLPESEPDEVTAEALRRRLTEGFAAFAKLKDKLTREQQANVLNTKGFSPFVDAVAQAVITKIPDKQSLIEQPDSEARAIRLIQLLDGELEISKMEARIAEKIRGAVERNQKDFVLREQLKAVQEELGEGGNEDAKNYRRRMGEKDFPEAVKAKLEKEISRFEALPMGSHEAPMAQAYIELVLDLPWLNESEDNLDLEHAREILDRDHFGMEKVKNRILESLAVQKLTGNIQSQILCLVGPPGVGKTSIVKAVAEAMGRRFVRMSLGGVHDEAEIRGHRRTYIGAQPGRIIDAMKRAGTVNPVLLFDEIDKLAHDLRGDPASAMLEALDPAQNNAFMDHFLELPYDLSKALLITTANDLGTIPRPLLDRMEVIEVPSYLFPEKLEIFTRHLLPKQLKRHGLNKSRLRLSKGAPELIIEGYTREAGVREMERVTASICRKAACEIVEGKTQVTVNAQRLTDWLGPKKHRPELTKGKEDPVGVVNGLAWTSVGGETLEVEASAVPGKGSLQLTGQLGDVMQESAKAALTYIRSNAARFDLADDCFEKLDIHIHVPEGAVPKDGPSAGVAMVTALVSALTGTPVKRSVAMTGEITLRGRVLPIGGLREKLLAALRNGITTVVIPEQNKESLFEVPQSIQEGLNIQFASQVDQVLAIALKGPQAPKPRLEVPNREGQHGTAALRH